MPAPVRSLAATLRGAYLRSWRYGPETERLVEDALDRDTWPAERWDEWRRERLAHVLHRAATRVPYYRDQWALRRRKGDRSSWECIENWPILTKEALRQTPDAFVADDCDIRRMFAEHTSGTTGTPLDLWWSRGVVREWFALFEARVRRWSGVSRHENWAILGGQPVVPPYSTRPPFWVWNAAMNQLYLSANHLSRRNTRAFLDALRRYRVTHMVVYSSSASLLSQEACELGNAHAELRLVATNAEPLFSWQRDAIAQGLSHNIRETYGMGEAVTAASECEAGSLHLWPEVGWLELLEDSSDSGVLPGQPGRFVCTSLLNADMPLIRYALGDRGSVPAASAPCRCGRSLPMLAGVEGRTNDLLQAPDGRRVYWVNPVFYGLPIREAQVIQDAIDHMRVCCVPAPGFGVETERAIRDRLLGRLGSIDVDVELMDAIPRGPNGKFRAVICALPSVLQRNGSTKPDGVASA